MGQRALLTEREREVIQGTDINDIENVNAYKQKIRTRVRKRIKNLEDDIEILSEEEPELADGARRSVCGPSPMFEQVRDEIRELREKLHSETGKV
ncbi:MULTISPECIES: hypothetical protein [Haloferax]|uniref:Uncharacterized protein n=1 Tax=Haloferax marinum TaxID=2666143 RepID=A0A6A8G9E8_9EURY|nr:MULTISPECIES: hypothetical protein [Haloferax]KAB1198125.1 hypothetical protein Hfx1150_11580 [Haloferax sp. CBA1150]MRW97202.1 hypothetical protein [Haloferax marinum]